MKTERRFFRRSARAFQRPSAGNSDRTPAESKCLACGQIVDATVESSLKGGGTAVACPDPVDRLCGKGAKKSP